MVRWRFPGEALEAVLNGASGAGAVSLFDVQVSTSALFPLQTGSTVTVSADRVLDAIRVAGSSTDIADLAAWSTLQIRVPVQSEAPLFVRVRGSNGDGVTGWFAVETSWYAPLGAATPSTDRA